MNDAKNVSAGKPKITGAIHAAPLGTPLTVTPIEELDAAFKGLDIVRMPDLPTAQISKSTRLKPGEEIQFLSSRARKKILITLCS